MLYPGITSHVRLGKYVWAWLVNEDDWTRRLGHYAVGFSLLGSLARGFGPKPMVPTLMTLKKGPK